MLWAREHAANEYTLLLGNGRDLITIDAAVQFRIADARAWRYHSQNPADALRAIAYRAVMRIDRQPHAGRRAVGERRHADRSACARMVQQDADALGLGVEVLGFTVGGMHPPVAVAPDYQAVVSAELGKVTAVVNAQAYRNQTVPARRGRRSLRADERARAPRAPRRSATRGGRGVELPHAASRSTAPRREEYLLPPPARDAREGPGGPPLHGRRRPHPAGRR